MILPVRVGLSALWLTRFYFRGLRAMDWLFFAFFSGSHITHIAMSIKAKRKATAKIAATPSSDPIELLAEVTKR